MRQHVDCLLVDEGQDLNRWQLGLVLRLTRLVKRTVLVLDPDQTIHSWRGARPDVAGVFLSKFPNAVRVNLAINHRSTQAVLDLANHVAGRRLVSAKPEPGRVPVCLRFRSPPAETYWVAGQAERAAQRPREPGDPPRLAILYRTADEVRLARELLDRRHVPYRNLGTEDRLTDLTHVRDVLAHLRLVVHPGDDLALRRALRLCHRIGDKRAQTLATKVAGLPLVSGLAALAPHQGRAQADLLALSRLLEVVATESSPVAQLELVRDYYLARTQVRHQLPQGGNPRDVQRALERLVEVARDVDSTWVLLAKLVADPPPRDERADDSQMASVVLSTIHGYKGLAADSVILLGARDGQIPHKHRGAEPSRAALEEERRLLYVAVTRAERRLTITWCGRDDQRCRFLVGVPTSVCRRVWHKPPGLPLSVPTSGVRLGRRGQGCRCD